MWLALACAVCGAGDDPARGSYVWMSLAISVLPLLMLGGIAGFVFMRTRETPPPSSDDGAPHR